MLGVIGRGMDRGAYGGNGLRRVFDLSLDCGGNAETLSRVFSEYAVLFRLGNVFTPELNSITELPTNLSPRYSIPWIEGSWI